MNKINERKIEFHTGSAPGCQNGPTKLIQEFLNDQPFSPDEAQEIFDELFDLMKYQPSNDEEKAAENSDSGDGHRCFNRQYYSLTVDDVRDILEELSN